MGADRAPGGRAEPADGRRPFLAEVLRNEADLRRDLATSLTLGVSPHRYSGWEPETRTRYVYDSAGHLVETISTTEPEYDDIDRAMFAALAAWRDDLHSCGRPLSESLHDPDRPNDQQIQYVVGTQVCRACQALDRRHADRHAEDKALIDGGRNPDSYRLDVVVPAETAAALVVSGEASQE